jgi:hypothetical protein
VYYSNPPAASYIKANCTVHNRERMVNYAVNVLYVLGFLSSGDGGTEAAGLLGLLGLPNDTTMESRSFAIIEETISPAIQRLTDAILMETLQEEVRLTMEASSTHDDGDYAVWQQARKGLIEVNQSKYAKISASFDMAWQQRNSGNRYASPSGHALLVGKYTRKAIALCIKSKLCNFCKSWVKKHGDAVPVKEHDCLKNHEGSSGSMEPQACLDMVVDLYNKHKVVVDMICADDDSSTRALLRWSNEDHMKNNNTDTMPQVPITKGINKGKLQDRPDKGRLPGNVPEPSFVADPNHQKKVLTGELIALQNARAAEKKTMPRMDSTRIGKNFGYMILSLSRMPEAQYCSAGTAVLKHHFDMHDHCGPWCSRKRQMPEQCLTSGRYYRDMNKKPEALLYAVLDEKVSRFITLERLKEVAHGMDTQVNESFNNTVSWFAPKNKVYCGSRSLTNRIRLALGINTLGLLPYFKRLYAMLGINMTENIIHFLEVKSNNRIKRLAKLKTKDKKNDRLKRKFQQLKDDTEVARKERSKRDGTYKKGMNMAEGNTDGYTEEDLNNNSTKKRAQIGMLCALTVVAKGTVPKEARSACTTMAPSQRWLQDMQVQPQQTTSGQLRTSMCSILCRLRTIHRTCRSQTSCWIRRITGAMTMKALLALASNCYLINSLYCLSS